MLYFYCINANEMLTSFFHLHGLYLLELYLIPFCVFSPCVL